MHYPPPQGPQQPGYGPPGYPGYQGGYGGPPGPYGAPPPPRRSGSGAGLAVIIALAIVGVLGLGTCGALVFVGGLGAVAGIDAGAVAPPATTTPEAKTEGERTIGRTPLAEKLEGALKSDGIPLGSVECPLSPPSTGSFSCAVLPDNEGDPAEVVVTNGPQGIAYELQKGFVVLDGPKLAVMFAGMAKRAGAPTMVAPCFRGKILKHADTSFSCEVQNQGVVVGMVTTEVIGVSGDVKMNYAPNPTTGR